jgi:chemotaxis protein CheD
MSESHYFLQCGYIYVPDHGTSISAVAGSGVCVCLYDRKRRTGGMNHFCFPYMDVRGKTTAVYGNIATITLVKMMQSCESSLENLEAQIFGGAFNPLMSDRNIGAENIEIARKILRKFNIPVISEDIGGKKGRKIVFNTHTNEVAVLKADTLRKADWYPYGS